MEAKLGFRFHKRRSDVPYDEHVRDPMAQDVFDVEADLTYANDSLVPELPGSLPGHAAGKRRPGASFPLNGAPGIDDPPNADVPHEFKDVYGVRLGGDYNVLRDQLAIRGGGFFQSNGQNAQYQNIDFAGSAELRLRPRHDVPHPPVEGEGERARDLPGLRARLLPRRDERRRRTASRRARRDRLCSTSVDAIDAVTSDVRRAGATPYRTPWPINLGTITNSVNVLNVGLGYKF